MGVTFGASLNHTNSYTHSTVPNLLSNVPLYYLVHQGFHNVSSIENW